MEAQCLCASADAQSATVSTEQNIENNSLFPNVPNIPKLKNHRTAEIPREQGILYTTEEVYYNRDRIVKK